MSELSPVVGALLTTIAFLLSLLLHRMPLRKVVVFGTFDPIHQGHRDFFRQARSLGDYLMVIVARDSVVRLQKKREPYQPETARLAAVAQLPGVDEVRLGDENPEQLRLLKELEFDVVALGYDQDPADEVVRQELRKRGKQTVTVARLKSYHPEQFKSTYVRKKDRD